MTTLEQPTRLARTGSLGPLSESIIPAVPGKFYAYSSVFTDGKPLYALMDCKANKSRAILHADELGREAHLYFGFYSTTRARVSSIKMAQAAGLLGDVKAGFDDVWVSLAQIAVGDFYALCARRDSAKLVAACEAVCLKPQVSTPVASGDIIAVVTSARKHGLFLVRDVTPTSVSVDACHILLP